MTQESFEAKQATIDGWYILEIFGHQRYAGYVTVQNLGIAAMVRVDVPALEERERVTKRGEYAGGTYVPPGSTVKDGAVPGYTKLFGVGAIYAMTPCTNEACLAAVEEIQPRPMMPISIPANGRALAAAVEPEDSDDFDTDDEDDDAEPDDNLPVGVHAE